MQIKELVWDKWNEDHIAKKGISRFDVEAVLTGEVKRPLIEKSRQGTLAVWGISSGGDYLLIILSPRGKGSYYLVTARWMENREKRRYQKWLR